MIEVVVIKKKMREVKRLFRWLITAKRVEMIRIMSANGARRR